MEIYRLKLKSIYTFKIVFIAVLFLEMLEQNDELRTYKSDLICHEMNSTVRPEKKGLESSIKLKNILPQH